MPVLIVEHSGKRRRTPMNGRTSIGRTGDNDIVIEHPAVSRIHAVIECVDGIDLLYDPGSKNGVIIGDEPVYEPRPLHDGDRIAIGPAILTYYASDDFIESPGRAALSETHAGMLMDCDCGAKLWVPKEMVGGRGQCQKCGRTVTLGESTSPGTELLDSNPQESNLQTSRLPQSNPPQSNPPQSNAAVTHTCSICQWRIDPSDAHHTCPSCGLVFHADCWTENRGCSAYGCNQVNILDQPEPGAAETEEIGHPPIIAPGAHAFPWEFALLAGSVVASLLGLLIFGVTALLTMLASGMYLLRNGRRARVRVLLGAMGVSLVGLIAGVVVSCFWWLGSRLD